jgi:hypothetical protein
MATIVCKLPGGPSEGIRWVRPAQDAIATTAIDTVGAATERLSVHRFVGPKRIKGTAGVYEAGVAAVA